MLFTLISPYLNFTSAYTISVLTDHRNRWYFHFSALLTKPTWREQMIYIMLMHCVFQTSTQKSCSVFFLWYSFQIMMLSRLSIGSVFTLFWPVLMGQNPYLGSFSVVYMTLVFVAKFLWQLLKIANSPCITSYFYFMFKCKSKYAS